jgi:hypothetical protein
MENNDNWKRGREKRRGINLGDTIYAETQRICNMMKATCSNSLGSDDCVTN